MEAIVDMENKKPEPVTADNGATTNEQQSPILTGDALEQVNAKLKSGETLSLEELDMLVRHLNYAINKTTQAIQSMSIVLAEHITGASAGGSGIIRPK